MTMVTGQKDSVFQRFEGYRPSKSTLVWACGLTVVATLVVGFGWAGWVTGDSASKAVVAANLQLASAVCVERFNAQPGSAAKLSELKALPDSFKRRQFIEAGGWATMPNKTFQDSLIAENCSKALMT